MNRTKNQSPKLSFERIILAFIIPLCLSACNQPSQAKIEPTTQSYNTYNDSISTEDTLSTISDSVVTNYTPEVQSNEEEIIGTWVDENGSIYRMYKTNGEIYLYNSYYDGSSGTDHMTRIKRFGKKGYVIVDDEREFYYIKNDKLYIYDMFGDVGLIFQSL